MLFEVFECYVVVGDVDYLLWIVVLDFNVLL